jgi:hypothetical protein
MGSSFQLARSETHRETAFSIYGGLRKGLSSSYDYLGGGEGNARISQSYFSETSAITLWLIGGRETSGSAILTAGTLPLQNWFGGIGAGASWAIHPQTELGLSASYTSRNYDQLATPGNVHRRDGQLITSVRLSRRHSASISFWASLDWTWNCSSLENGTVDNKNFKNAVLLGGITARAFPEN